MDSDLAWVNGKSGRQRWRYADTFQRSIISEAIYHLFISFLFPSPTYNYFWFASAILNLQVHEVYEMADVGTTEKIANENHWKLVSSWRRTRNTAGVPPPHTCNIRYKNTLAISGLIQNNTILDHDRRTDRLLFSDFTGRLAGAVGSVYNEERALLKMRMYEAIMTRKGTNTPRPMTATAYE